MTIKKNKLTYLKIISFIIIFIFLQFNSLNLYSNKQFTYSDSYIKINYLTYNTENCYYKIEIDSDYYVSKRKIIVEDFINILYIEDSINLFFKDKVATYFSIHLKNYLIYSLIPRAPPFTFNF